MLAPKPSWLKIRAPQGENYQKIKEMLRGRSLFTVCEEAHCPNLAECWAGGTATIMVLGDTCTRGCRFCNVKSGNPKQWLDAEEPNKVARSVKEMGLEYIVLTTVDRDDLTDQGAQQFASIVRAIKQLTPHVLVETLAMDFRGDTKLLQILLDANMEVFAHNMETVERLTKKVRDGRAHYQQSLKILEHAKKYRPSLVTKSSVMLGLGEQKDEVIQTMKDLRAIHVDIFTLGQYLQPSKKHLPVVEYIHPDQFKTYENIGLELGFKFVASGPLVRSSYRAGEFFIKAFLEERRRHGITIT